MKQNYISTNSFWLFYSFKVKLRSGKVLHIGTAKWTDGISLEINVQPYSTFVGC